ncbi:S1C family serine protease [Pelagibacteraceae bacterium]|nr:S1C family serine protease [Pelagibacteraceae bacterium]
MKKLLAIVVLGLLWSSSGFSEDLYTLSSKNNEFRKSQIAKTYIKYVNEYFENRDICWKRQEERGWTYNFAMEWADCTFEKEKTTIDKYGLVFLHAPAHKRYSRIFDSAKAYSLISFNNRNYSIRPHLLKVRDITLDAFSSWENRLEREYLAEIETAKEIGKKIAEAEKEKKTKSSGTAFFISKKGYLLTNNHVVEGCKAQKINYFNKEYDAQIIATDKNLDLALLKVDTKNNNYINFSKSEIEKLQKVYVAGYPFGKGLSDDLKVSSGIISSNKGFEDNSNEFQIDAPINPGNSGGPIVNDTGELVGIAVAGFAKDMSEGINFGIKSSTARTFLNINKVKPGSSYMTFAMNNKKLLNLLEESTVYTFCD